MKLDQETLKQLIAEAQKNYNTARKLFLKHDNHEDMHDMEMWDDTAQWLEAKLT